jgi:hypothetical protein
MTLERILLAPVFAAYLVIATMVWRRAAWVFADRARIDPEGRLTSFEIVWGILVGAAFASIWPLTLGMWLTTTRGIPYLGRRFLLPPPDVRREREAMDAADQERRIAELERLIETSDR